MAQVLIESTPKFKPVLDKKTIELTKDRPAKAYFSPRNTKDDGSQT